MKKFFAVFAFALALTLTASPVLAAEVDVTGTNQTTGAYSLNKNTYDVDHDVDVDLDNKGYVKNKAYADANTGGNEQKKNTEAGDIESGEIDASTDWENVVNDGASLLGAGEDGLEVTADFTNDTTGADSKNKNDLDVDHDVDLDLENTAFVLNKLGLWANTGYNSQYKNTEGGSIVTGDIGVDFLADNSANNDSGFLGADFGTTSVDVTAENHKTGADSTNKNTVDVDNDVDVDVTNKAKLINKVYVDANTGGNTQAKNTLAGDITTGGVSVTANVTNEANNGSSLASASGSGASVTADLVNDTTGADSKNVNDVDVDHDVDVDVDNEAKVVNKVEVDANTGDNEQSKNTEGGSIDTGSVSVDFTSSTTVNSN